MGAAGGIVQLGPYRLQRKWDPAPKIRFELDSPVEEAVTSEPVSENSIPEAFWAVISRFWHRKWHKIAILACGRRDRLTATKPLRSPARASATNGSARCFAAAKLAAFN